MIHISKGNIPLELYNMPVIVWGGGYTGKIISTLMTENKVNIDFIIDDDEVLQGNCINNIKVISYSAFVDWSKEYKQVSVVLTTIYGKKVLKRLEALNNVKVYEMYDWYSEVIGNKEWIEKIVNDVDKVREMQNELRFLRNKWEDDESVRVLDGLFQYIETKDLNDLVDICTEDEQYFIPQVKAAIRMPLNVIDAGAYRGELLQAMKNNKFDIDSWYCFEADSKNFACLLQQSEHNGLAEKQQICINKGLWSKTGKLFFESGKETGSKIVDYRTDNMIDVVSIDDYMKDKKCNFIKMDIEGAELPALKGGKKLIHRERPILAISIYHSLDDFWQIPKYLMQELDNYKWYVRHHALIFNETVLYGIPCEI